MLIKINSIENKIEIQKGCVFSLEICNKNWFSNVCRSFILKNMDDTIEPFCIWDDEGRKLKSSDYLVICNPLELPWNDKTMLKALYEKVNEIYSTDYGFRECIDVLNNKMQCVIEGIDLSFESNYKIYNDWTIANYLNYQKFKPQINNEDPLIDTLINFMNYRYDIGLNNLLVFINLKIFLSEKDYNAFCEHVFYLKNKVFLIENVNTNILFDNETKLHIDKDFIENFIK